MSGERSAGVQKPGRLTSTIEDDIAAVARIGAVPTILRTFRESTGLRYTLIARVLPDRWVACAVHDELEFGLGVGGELDVATTLCSVVRDTHEPVVIDEVRTDPVYCGHPTPTTYGFQSHVSVQSGFVVFNAGKRLKSRSADHNSRTPCRMHSAAMRAS